MATNMCLHGILEDRKLGHVQVPERMFTIHTSSDPLEEHTKEKKTGSCSVTWLLSIAFALSVFNEHMLCTV